MSESFQHKLSRIRPPRVQITYDVEIGDAIQMKEIPFVVGIMSDLSGMPYADRADKLDSTEYTFHQEGVDPKKVALVPDRIKPLPERKFVDIDRDNFEEIMAKIMPVIQVSVEDKLNPPAEGADPTNMKVELAFAKMEHFEPLSVVSHVPKISEVFGKRTALSNLMAKLDGNLNLYNMLSAALADKAQLDKLAAIVTEEKKALGMEEAKAEAAPPPAA